MTRTHDKNYFYKYTSAGTAKKILANKKLRYSSPLIFNDPFDHQIELQIDFDEETFVRECSKEITNILHNKHKSFSPKNTFGILLQQLAHRAEAQDVEKICAEITEGARDAYRNLPRQLAEINSELLNDIHSKRVLCVSERNDSILMWSHYSQKHTGVVFKLLCIDSLDNTLLVAQPVNYVKNLPLYSDLSNFIKFITGQSERLVTPEALFNYIVCTKCADWAYEKEWRVAFPDYDSTGALHTDFKEDPRIIDSIYLGCNIDGKDEMDLLGMIGTDKQLAHVDIYKTHKKKNEFALEFVKLTL